MRASDAELLRAGDARAFGRRYGRHVDAVHGWFAAPIELRTRGTGGGTVLRFVAYAWLPLSEETEKLLSIAAPHPGAPVVRDSAAYDALQQRLFATG